jgi:acetyl-CoA acyltransferase
MKKALNRRTFVVGGRTLPFIGKGHPDFIWKKHPLAGHKENPSLEDYITQSVQAALKDTHTPASAIEKVFSFKSFYFFY